jgi:hypothetical protein
MLKNKCCLYVIISICFFSITICNLLIDFLLYFGIKQLLISIAKNKELNMLYVNCIDFKVYEEDKTNFIPVFLQLGPCIFIRWIKDQQNPMNAFCWSFIHHFIFVCVKDSLSTLSQHCCVHTSKMMVMADL